MPRPSISRLAYPFVDEKIPFRGRKGGKTFLVIELIPEGAAVVQLLNRYEVT